MRRVLDLKVAVIALVLAIFGVCVCSTPTRAENDLVSGEVENAINNGLPNPCKGEECTEVTNGIAKEVINTLLLVAGTIAVAMVIFGGVQMTTSAGNPATVTKAKRTITYSVIGIVVVVLAYAIVNFVVDRL